jgi:hypothetical protein
MKVNDAQSLKSPECSFRTLSLGFADPLLLSKNLCLD